MSLYLFTKIQANLMRIGRDHVDHQNGAVAVEYALLVVLIALVMAIGAATFGSNLNLKFAGITI